MTTPLSPLVNEPLPQPRRWGEAERARLSAMLDQSSLFYWQGPQTAALLREFRQLCPLRDCFPTSSGTAALHVATAALRLAPGDEVIVPAITDLGSVIGVLTSRPYRSSLMSRRAPTRSIRPMCDAGFPDGRARSRPCISQAIRATWKHSSRWRGSASWS